MQRRCWRHRCAWLILQCRPGKLPQDNRLRAQSHDQPSHSRRTSHWACLRTRPKFKYARTYSKMQPNLVLSSFFIFFRCILISTQTWIVEHFWTSWALRTSFVERPTQLSLSIRSERTCWPPRTVQHPLLLLLRVAAEQVWRHVCRWPSRCPQRRYPLHGRHERQLRLGVARSNAVAHDRNWYHRRRREHACLRPVRFNISFLFHQYFSMSSTSF